MEFIGNGFERLAHQEDAKCAGHVGHANSQHGVKQAQSGNHRIVFDNQHLRQNEQLHQYQDEYEILSRKLNLRKGETSESR